MTELNWLQRAGMKMLRLSVPTIGPTDLTSDAEDRQWTSLTSSPKDLPGYDQDYMQQLALYMYRSNPIAHRVVKLIRAFVVGEGIVIRATDKRVDKLVEKFWNNPRNNWRWRFPERVENLSIYGEAAYPVMKEKLTGQILLGFMSPSMIGQIKTNPQNQLDITHLVTKEGFDSDMNTVPPQTYRLVRIVDDPTDLYLGLRDGEMMYWGINKSLDMNRGISDLYSLTDWLGIFDGILFARAERQQYSAEWWRDIELTGMSQEQVEKWFDNFIISQAKRRTARTFAHNEKVKMTALSPTLSSSGDEKEIEYIFRMIWGGSGMASTAFGDSDAGRANAAEMNEFTFKSLTDTQVIWRNILLDIFDLVIDQAIYFRKLPREVDRTISVFMPKISMRDLQRSTSALRNLVTSIRLLMDTDILAGTDKTRLRAVLHSLLDHIDQSSADMYILKEPVTKEETDLEKATANGHLVVK